MFTEWMTCTTSVRLLCGHRAQLAVSIVTIRPYRLRFNWKYSNHRRHQHHDYRYYHQLYCQRHHTTITTTTTITITISPPPSLLSPLTTLSPPLPRIPVLTVTSSAYTDIVLCELGIQAFFRNVLTNYCLVVIPVQLQTYSLTLLSPQFQSPNKKSLWTCYLPICFGRIQSSRVHCVTRVVVQPFVSLHNTLLHLQYAVVFFSWISHKYCCLNLM